MKRILIILTLLINCQSKNSDNEEKNRILAGVVLSRITTGTSATTTPSSTSCSNATPSFSSLASAGVNNSCARSGCHAGASPQSGYDATSFNSNISRVTVRNASGSLLYQKVNGGSMAQYSTSQINQAIFCWIQGGAIQ